MSFLKFRSEQTAAVCATPSLLASYGTLAVLALFGIFGLAVSENCTTWAETIVGIAILSEIALGIEANKHRNIGPLLLGLMGLVAIAYALFWSNMSAIEFAGFGLLSGAVTCDWWLPERHVAHSDMSDTYTEHSVISLF